MQKVVKIQNISIHVNAFNRFSFEKNEIYSVKREN